MAVRREQVILDLTDNVTPGLARMAVAAGVADRAIKSMGGTSVKAGTDLDKTAVGAKRVGDSTGRAGPQIDKFSGRLRLLADAAVILGPALIPLGASVIPVLTASLVGLSSAAGALGVTVLAFKGLGDGLQALDDYQLEPTAENLAALRLEMEKLGPAGAHFARFLDDLEPAMRDLQMVARAGLFPGVEDGITDLLTRLPQVRRVVADLAEGMGDLARDAGGSLGGPEFTAFFDYMETDARPTLEAFARSAGNVALGISNMLVAFAPLNRDFTGGLEDATKAFADWSKGLDDNESFQDFLSYVRESGPAVVDFLAALSSALAGLIRAGAPLGKVVLPALTGMAKAFALIANSPIGPGLYIAAAALLAFNRAAKIADATSSRFTGTWEKMSRTSRISAGVGGVGLLAASMSDLDDKAGLANTAMFSMAGLMVGGPWGLAVGAGIGLTADLAAANDDLGAAVQAANDAMNTGDVDAMRLRYEQLGDEIRETAADAKIGLGQDISGPGDVFRALGAQWSNLSGETDEARRTFADLGDEIGRTVNDVGLFSTGVQDAADSVRDLNSAMAALQGWLDKRGAIRDYRDSLRELAKGIKDGFGRKDVENLDAVGENIIKVANSIKDPALKQDFLVGAINSLNALAEKSGPKAAAQIQRLIDKMTELGLAKVTPRVDADTQKAEAAFERSRRSMADLDKATAAPKVDADADNAFATFDRVTAELNALDGDAATTYVRTIRTTEVRPGTSVVEPHAAVGDGTPRRGTPGRTGRTSPQGRVARVGPLDVYTARGAGNTTVNAYKGLDLAARGATAGLRGLQKQLEAQQKEYDRAKAKRDEAISRRDEISSGIREGLGGDIWATSEGSTNVWAAGATAGGVMDPTGALRAQTDRARRLVAALNTLKQKGVTGPALLEIIGTGNVERAELMAGLPVAELASFSSAYGEAQSALAAAGLAGGNAIELDNIREWRRTAAAELKELREIKQAIKDAEKSNDRASDRNADRVTAGVNGAAGNGHRRGKNK